MRNWRPLLVAVILSLAVHWALLSGLRVDVPDHDSPFPRILEARLVPMKPAEPVAEPATKQAEVIPPKPKRRPVPPRPKPVAEQASSPPALPQPVQEPGGSAEPAAPGEPVAPPAAETAAARAVATGSLPERVIIRFVANWGVDGPGVGRVEYRWQREGDRYTLQSVTESTGVVQLLKPVRILQTSLGEITQNGLRPETFAIQNSGRRTDSALFDWTERSLQLVDSEKIQTLPLADSAQDIMSVLFQFAFVPPVGEVLEFAVVTGRKLEIYRFSVMGEETVQVLGQAVRTLHIRRPRTDADDGMDIWLAKDRYYLPVKIIRTDRKDTRPAELIATDILIPQEER